MKLVKALLPFLLITIVKLFIDMTVIPGEHLNYLIKAAIFYNITYITVIIFSIFYFRKYKKFKLILIVVSIIVFLNIALTYGPWIIYEVFHTTHHFSLEFKNFSIIYLISFALIALLYAIKAKSKIAIIFGAISILVAIYVQGFYIANLDYEPYLEFRTMIHFGLYRSLGRSILSIILISLSVFTSFYSLLKSE